MTTTAIHDFAKAVHADEEMGRGLVAAIGQKQGGNAAEAFAAFAQGQGFAVTREDAVALQAAASRTEEETLSNDELDGVAGGVSLLPILGLLPGAMVAVGTLAVGLTGGAIAAVVRK